MAHRKPRTRARRLAHNNREFILISRMAAGDCLWCGRHDGENIRGNHANWGKKRAAKTLYATRKGRKVPKNFQKSWYKKHGLTESPLLWQAWNEAWYAKDYAMLAQIEEQQKQFAIDGLLAYQR